MISIQQGNARWDLHHSSLASALHPAQARFDAITPDFKDTASLLNCCDLLITIDTSVAHLGGALGLPTWVMLKCHPSWQWGEFGQETPWYSSVRCFRQHIPFDWSGVIADVDKSLKNWIDHWFRFRNTDL